MVILKERLARPRPKLMQSQGKEGVPPTRPGDALALFTPRTLSAQGHVTLWLQQPQGPQPAAQAPEASALI